MSGLPFVSIIIPCCNEEKFIGVCLDGMVANDYPKDRFEVLVVDGMSKDVTRSIVATYTRQHSFIRLLDNPKKITPSAINIGISNSKGEIIMLMGAHASFDHTAIPKCVKAIMEHKADGIGGIVVTRPANNTPKAQAIAIGLSHPFGVGNAYFRIGASKTLWVDTVPFGCYRREVFERVGMFDEELVRNQDDEFNLRLIKRGGRLRLVPEIVSYYYARESLTKLWRMYYQYGYFKPLVARKVGGVLTVRQVVPFTFVLSLLATGMMVPWFPMMGRLFGIIILVYAVADISCSAIVAFKKGFRCGVALSLVFPVLHLSYGLGYLMGAVRFLLLRGWRSGISDETPITR